MKPTSISLVSLFNQGCHELHKDHQKIEVSKQGNLRAGAAGALLPDGRVVGGCHRKAFARWIGQPNSVPNPMTQSNFDAGFRNEDNWMEKLERSWDGVILCEDDIPVEWFTSQGVKVSGRPDMVLCTHDNVGHEDRTIEVETPNGTKEVKPLLVIEHKAIVSTNAAAKRWLGEVDPSHFIQACHYSMEIGAPATIVYSFSGIGMVPFWIKKTDKERFWPKGKGWEVKPFKKEFRIGCDTSSGLYYYVDVTTGGVYLSDVSAKMIRDYYELLVDMRDTKSLYKRHSNTDLKSDPMRYNVCDYCELKDTCDQYEGNYQRWVDEVMKEGDK